MLQAELTGFGGLAVLTLDGATLYTLNNAGTLATWDVSSGTAAYVGQANLRYVFNLVLISTVGNHVFAANGVVYIGSGGGASSDGGGFVTVDVSDPAHPQLIAGYSALDTAGVAPTIAITRLPVTVDPQASGLELYEGQSFWLGVRVTDDVQVARIELLGRRAVSCPRSWPTVRPP